MATQRPSLRKVNIQEAGGEDLWVTFIREVGKTWQGLTHTPCDCVPKETLYYEPAGSRTIPGGTWLCLLSSSQVPSVRSASQASGCYDLKSGRLRRKSL